MEGQQAGAGAMLPPPAAAPPTDGALIVLTAPFTETIDHAGYFIQMSMASLPMWLEEPGRNGRTDTGVPEAMEGGLA